MSDLVIWIQAFRAVVLIGILLVALVLERRHRGRPRQGGIQGWIPPAASGSTLAGAGIQPLSPRRAGSRGRVALASGLAASGAMAGIGGILFAFNAEPAWWATGIAAAAGVASLTWLDATRVPGSAGRPRPLPSPVETPEAARERWQERLTRVDPADRPAAEAALARLGRSLRLRPVPVVWVRSPLEAELARVMLGAIASAPISTEGRPLRPVVDGQLALPSFEPDPGRRPAKVMYWASPPCPQGVPEGPWNELLACLRLQLPTGPVPGTGFTQRDAFARLERVRFLAFSLKGDAAAVLRASMARAMVGLAATRRLIPRRRAEPVPGPAWPGAIVWLEHFGLVGGNPVARALRALVDAGADWWPTEDIGCLILVDRPAEVHLDDALLPHREDGPAIRYRDGFEVFAISGHEAPRSSVGDRALITVDGIQGEQDDFIRRFLRERYGSERYRQALLEDPVRIAKEPDRALARGLIEEIGFERICQEAGRVAASDLDMAGEPRRLWRVTRRADPDLVVVEVANSTPEPDGSRRRYWLRVPPTVRTCRDAVAWTFGIAGRQYEVTAET